MLHCTGLTRSRGQYQVVFIGEGSAWGRHPNKVAVIDTEALIYLVRLKLLNTTCGLSAYRPRQQSSVFLTCDQTNPEPESQTAAALQPQNDFLSFDCFIRLISRYNNEKRYSKHTCYTSKRVVFLCQRTFLHLPTVFTLKLTAQLKLTCLLLLFIYAISTSFFI